MFEPDNDQNIQGAADNQQLDDPFFKLRRKIIKSKELTSKRFAAMAIAKKKREKRLLVSL